MAHLEKISSKPAMFHLTTFLFLFFTASYYFSLPVFTASYCFLLLLQKFTAFSEIFLRSPEVCLF